VGFQGAADFDTPIYITPSRASKSAIGAIEKAGGSVWCQYYNALALRDCVNGRTDRVQAAPTAKKDICKSAKIHTARVVSLTVLF
jgi:large subunit ribosomal protein L15